MLIKRADWAGKVRIIGLSLDQTVDKVKSHVIDQSWVKVEHYHVKNNLSTAAQQFGVKGIPMIALVDKTGKIVFIGHPRQRKNLEQDIDTLVNDGDLNQQANTAAPQQGRKWTDCEQMTAAFVVIYLLWLFISTKYNLFPKPQPEI